MGAQGVVSLTFRELSKIILQKIHNARNRIYGENFKLKLCTCAQSMDLGTCTKFQLEILIRCMIFTIHKFRENILDSLRNVKLPPATYSHMLVYLSIPIWKVPKPLYCNKAKFISTL